MIWRQAEGWLDDHEAKALMVVASGMDVLEIGSYCGRSTLALAETANKVFCIDWHCGDKDVGNKDTLPKFLDNIKDVRHKVFPLIGKSTDIGPILCDKSFDVVFIDGSHTYNDVLYDTKLALRLCKHTIMWHDWNEKHVNKAILDCGIPPGVTAGRCLMWQSMEIINASIHRHANP